MTSSGPLRRHLFPMLATVAICSALSPAARADVRRVQVPAGFVIVDHVNVRNGNFSFTWSAFDNGTGVPYRRTINSRAVNRGVFGLGWGSTFDTRLMVMADGTVVVRENGNGARTVYGRASADAVAAGASEIAETVRTLRPGDYQSNLAERLTNSFLLRFETIEKYAIKFDPPTDNLPVDPRTTYVGGEDDCGDAGLKRLPADARPAYFIRRHCTEDREAFDADGNLVSFGPRGQSATIQRKDHRIQRIAMAGGRFLAFTYAPQKTTVTDEAGHAIVYEFDQLGRNTAMTQAGNRYKFSYDDHSNLTRVDYIDTTSMVITYNKDGQATSYKDREGKVTTFEYQDTPGGYKTVVRKPNADGDIDTVIYLMTK